MKKSLYFTLIELLVVTSTNVNSVKYYSTKFLIVNSFLVEFFKKNWLHVCSHSSMRYFHHKSAITAVNLSGNSTLPQTKYQ